MDVPAGWYRTDDGQMRYRDGTGWSEHVAPSPAVTPTGAAPTVHASGGSEPVRDDAMPPAVAGWFGWGGLLLTADLGAAGSGISGLLISSGLFVLVVAVITLIRGRIGWARLRSRAVGGAASGAAIALLVAGGAVADPDPEPAAAPPVTAPSTSSAPSPSPSPVASSPSTTMSVPVAASALAVTPTRNPAAATSPARAARGTALAAVADLPVKGRAAKTGYSRDRFGQAWFDTDRNGCDTRGSLTGTV